MKNLQHLLALATTYVERGWTQKAMARNAKGQEVGCEDPNACEWCLLGALNLALFKVMGTWPQEITLRLDVMDRALVAVKDAANPDVPWNVAGWNDAKKRTQAEVVAVLRAAAVAVAQQTWVAGRIHRPAETT